MSGRDLSTPNALAGNEGIDVCWMYEPEGNENNWRCLCHSQNCRQTQLQCWHGALVFRLSLVCSPSLFFSLFSPVIWVRGKQFRYSTSLVRGRADEQLAPGDCDALRPLYSDPMPESQCGFFSLSFFDLNR